MAIVNIINKNKIIDVEIGTYLSEAIRKAIGFETPCSGKGICGKCKVRVKGELSSVSESEGLFISDGERLACMAKIIGDVDVEIINKSELLKSITKGHIREVALNSQYKKGYGVAIDLGTTGLSGYLIDFSNGKVLSSASSTNPQVEYGSDVLSRISFGCSHYNGIKLLKDAGIKGINQIIESLIKETKKEDIKNNIINATISGNTIMLHMIMGVSAERMSVAPFKPQFLNLLNISQKETSINISKEGIVTLLPSASSFIGADIVSGLVNYNVKKKKGNILYIDIGTNGEIVLCSNGNIYATATAAGPAFEGMNIECGSRAIGGAIDSFTIGDEIKYTTIENKEAKTICGSGIIDITAELLRNNIILKTGRINPKLDENLGLLVKNKKVYITDNIYISQEDIRNIQLAKGAICAGINMLLKECKEKIDDIEEFVIAGSFGYYLNENSLIEIGIIPRGFKGKVSFVGNVSLEGARIAMLNNDILEEMKILSRDINTIELSIKEEFEREFIRELKF